MRNPRVFAIYMATRPRGFALVLVPVYFIKHSVSCYIYYTYNPEFSLTAYLYSLHDKANYCFTRSTHDANYLELFPTLGRSLQIYSSLHNYISLGFSCYKCS